MRNTVRALAAFASTAVIAVSAATVMLLPDQAGDAADLGIIDVEQMFAIGAFEL